jgi:hypothetical protein
VVDLVPDEEIGLGAVAGGEQTLDGDDADAIGEAGLGKDPFGLGDELASVYEPEHAARGGGDDREEHVCFAGAGGCYEARVTAEVLEHLGDCPSLIRTQVHAGILMSTAP